MGAERGACAIPSIIQRAAPWHQGFTALDLEESSSLAWKTAVTATPTAKPMVSTQLGITALWKKNLVTSEAALPQPTQRIREYYTLII